MTCGQNTEFTGKFRPARQRPAAATKVLEKVHRVVVKQSTPFAALLPRNCRRTCPGWRRRWKLPAICGAAIRREHRPNSQFPRRRFQPAFPIRLTPPSVPAGTESPGGDQTGFLRRRPGPLRWKPCRRQLPERRRQCQQEDCSVMAEDESRRTAGSDAEIGQNLGCLSALASFRVPSFCLR